MLFHVFFSYTNTQIAKSYVQVVESESFRDLKQIKYADIVIASVGPHSKRPMRLVQCDNLSPTYQLFAAVQEDITIQPNETVTILSNWCVLAGSNVSLCFEISRFLDLMMGNVDMEVNVSKESGNLEDRYAINAGVIITNREEKSVTIARHCPIIDMDVETLKRHEMYQYKAGLFLPQFAEVERMTITHKQKGKHKFKVVFGRLLKMMN